MNIGGVLLAAGRAARFGADKRLQPLADGTPVAVAAARSLLGAVAEAVAVVRPGDTELAGLLAAEGLRPVEFAGADEGMGASLAFGVQALPQADAWLIALADMPFIRADTVRAIAAALSGGASLAAPSCCGRRGHPAGFARCWYTELAALGGDRGARRILEANRATVCLVPTTDAGVLRDIDVPRDLSGS